MKHVIIGTAGHVDHGKTSLVKALTGIDTDRLEEEKRRGVTIELGFAYLDFDDGTRVGIIDVPGHERFIHNMLAGAGGVDLAMLTVAADEGVMPQTREHLSILSQLGVSDGLVAVTKLDKAEPEWLALVTEDIEQTVQGTFLEGKPVIPVSARTGDGLAELKQALNLLVGKTDGKTADLPFRLPVDRVFPVDGFGIVVTGTLIEGAVGTGDLAEVLPSGVRTAARSIQVHGENVNEAFAGQRVAISLAGLKRGEVRRGDVIAARGTLGATNMIEVRLSVFPDSRRTIISGSGLHFYHGARSFLARVSLIGRKELKRGESSYARLILDQPLPCRRGDRFVVRFFSPVETVGGGVILDPSPKKRRRDNKAATDTLSIREYGSTEEIAGLAAYELGHVFSETDLCRRSDLDVAACRSAIDSLSAAGRVRKLLPDRYISAEILASVSEKCKRLLGNYHSEHPLRPWMNIAELRQKLLPGADVGDANAVLALLEESRTVRLSEKGAALPDFSIAFTPLQSNVREKVMKTLVSAGFDTPTPDEIALTLEKSEKKEFDRVLECMLNSGELLMLSPQIFWTGDVFDRAVVLLRGHFEVNREITLAECRDLLGTSRKYALAFLEYLDSNRVTRKTGDARTLSP